MSDSRRYCSLRLGTRQGRVHGVWLGGIVCVGFERQAHTTTSDGA